jgi:hypothetical protein
VGSGARPYAPPDTAIAEHPGRRTRHRTARFAFTATEPASFECALDSAVWVACASPFEHRVGKGKHTFAVRATDAFGLVDETAATFDWKVKKHRRHHHGHH